MAFGGGGYANRDLMEADSASLFADPLGIRPKDDPKKRSSFGGLAAQPVPLRSNRPPPGEAPLRQRTPGGTGFRLPQDEAEDDFAMPTRKMNRGDADALLDQDPRTLGGGRAAADPLPGAPPERDFQKELEVWGGAVGQFVWGLVAGGKQCCSMRDRNVDVEAAKVAAAVGRPPEISTKAKPEPAFPEPGGSRQTEQKERRSEAPPQPQTPTIAKPQARGQSAEEASAWDKLMGRDEDPPPFREAASSAAAASTASRGRTPPSAESDPFLQGNDLDKTRQMVRPKTNPDPPAKSKAEANDPFARDNGPPQASTPRGVSPAPAPRSVQFGSAPEPAPKSQAPAASSSTASNVASKADGPPAEGPLPKQWSWPPWCLNFKNSSVEVWVEDEGVGRWVPAQPQSRVVDKAGRDAYLCAEYNWDGEFYVQDFGPAHVRAKGTKTTVYQGFKSASSAPASRSDDLDSTKVFNGSRGNRSTAQEDQKNS
eukprot:TRINITY_DN23931_c0_g1_i1.p1 TRINITY_DN23931_c0_g1~~TRINITY_DN23931_c0_g1_i1.p1  ORF type:complete len:483 (+),score=123.52 TRINITY_DN23931_c0_g1_i1:119-1567(+)